MNRFALALCVCGLVAVALALPVEQQVQAQQVHHSVPALEGVLVEAASEVEAIRKARQLLDVDIDIFSGGGMCDLSADKCGWL